MICTEQERDALMAAVERYGNTICDRERAGFASNRYGELAGYAASQLAAIRAMLAPPDDAVAREQLRDVIAATAIESGIFTFVPIQDFREKFLYPAVDQIIALLRGEATRDE